MSESEDILTAPESETSASVSTLGSQGVREFLRYFIASAVALAADVGTLYFLTSIAGQQYLLSGAIAFFVGLVVVYVLSIRWVFERRSAHSVVSEFIFFAAIGLAGLVLNEVVLYVLTGMFGLFYLYSKGASVIVVFLWNFFARKYILFRA